MVEGNAKLVIDLGNSQTRVCTQYGVTGKKRPRKRFSYLSNGFSLINNHNEIESLKESNNYNEDNSRIFIYEETDSYYANGLIAESEYPNIMVLPSATAGKYDNLSSKLSIVNSLMEGMLVVADMAGTTVPALDIAWDVYALLPPQQISRGAKIMADFIKPINHLNFIMPDVQCNLNIKSVNILPEGLCAFFGVLFENKGIVRPEYQYLLDPDEMTIIIDIGAGTTDVLIVKGSEIIQGSRYSCNVGGNNVVGKVSTVINEQYRNLTMKNVSAACNSGILKAGARSIDISNFVKTAREEVAQEVVNKVQNFLFGANISIGEITRILVCGGGSVESQIDGVDSLGDHIRNLMKKEAEYALFIEPPMINKGGEMHRISPRDLNIVGASILAE